MHTVGDVVGKVHDLAFDGPACGIRRAAFEPVEHIRIVRINTKFGSALPFRMRSGLVERPWIFDCRVKRGTGQVHARGTAIGEHDLRLESCEQPQGLRVAFETADVPGDFSERTFPVMSERRVSKVVREAGAVDHVGIAAERRADLPSDLRDFQRMCEPGTGEIIRSHDQNLRFRTEPAQCG